MISIQSATYRGDKALNNWAEAAGLVNGPYEVAKTLSLRLLTRATSEGGTWIDHILRTDRQNNIKCTGAHTVEGSAWMTISDNVLPSVHAPITTPLVKVAPREFVELPLTDETLGKRFAEDMDTWLADSPAWEGGFEAGQFLHRLSIMPTRVTKRIAKGRQKSLQSSYKIGWSPTFVAYKVNINAMLETRRQVLGQHGRKRWKTNLDASADIIRIVNRTPTETMRY